MSEKLPDHHSLNLKLECNPTLWGLSSRFYAQVVNLYNNRVAYYTYNDDYSEKKIIQSPIGIFGYGGFWIKW